ncbi:MAG: BrnA antitoxin family protein [Pseudomonadota bacterium]
MAKKRSEIDFSDIPESTNEELSRATRINAPERRAVKKLIAIRIDPLLLNKLRKMALSEAKPYQTLIHELLEKAAKKVA